MMRTPAPAARRAAALAASATLAALAACSKDADLKLTTPPAAASFMQRYVAIGNSITAGFQSNGINDSTQARSYPVLIARAAGIDSAAFHVPSLNRPGCTPPIANFVTGALAGGAPAGSCYGRTAGSITATLNNVAVPGANSFDPTGQQGGGSNTLTTLFLGGRTQVERALDLDPTFASVWIGNNDVLGYALAGDSVTRNAAGAVTARVTDSATFATNYASMLTQLRSRNSALKGVLIGVVDVTSVPLLVPISVFNPTGGGTGPAAFNPIANAVVTQTFGRPIAFAPNCTGSQAAIAFSALRLLAAGANAALPPGAPFTFVCGNIPGVASATQGVLDDGERAFFVARVAAYNAYIKAAADAAGFAYYDPNTLLAAARTAGQIPSFPNVAGPAANPTRPFGPLISNDGVHPGSPAHSLLARGIIGVINAKYSVSIDATKVPDQAP